MTQGQSERSLGRSLLRRAGATSSGNGAGALFARLDALDQSADARQAAAADLLARWAARVRAGMWSGEIAALVTQAEALERALDESTESK